MRETIPGLFGVQGTVPQPVTGLETPEIAGPPHNSVKSGLDKLGVLGFPRCMHMYSVNAVEDGTMEDVSCDREGIDIVRRLLERREMLPWVATLPEDQQIQLCKVVHMLAEKQARTIFVVEQIKRDFGISVSVEHVEDLKQRFRSMYQMTVRERN
jgi:hypothetical protein